MLPNTGNAEKFTNRFHPLEMKLKHLQLEFRFKLNGKEIDRSTHSSLCEILQQSLIDSQVIKPLTKY